MYWHPQARMLYNRFGVKSNITECHLHLGMAFGQGLWPDVVPVWRRADCFYFTSARSLENSSVHRSVQRRASMACYSIVLHSKLCPTLIAGPQRTTGAIGDGLVLRFAWLAYCWICTDLYMSRWSSWGKNARLQVSSIRLARWEHSQFIWDGWGMNDLARLSAELKLQLRWLHSMKFLQVCCWILWCIRMAGHVTACNG
jgi:hypothetical protein